LASETILLPSSAAIWSSQLIIYAFSSDIRAGKVVKSFREGTLLEESLLVTTLRAVNVLKSELILFSSISPEKEENRTSGEGFLEAEEVKTLLEECLTI